MKNSQYSKDGIPTLKIVDPSGLDQYELIDVRRPDEYDGELGHIKGSKLVTLGLDLDNYLAREDKNKNILFICRSGMRSGKATEQAIKMGFNNVFNMEGGMITWNEHSFPLDKE
jgi:rhodanese-related sulfurtransferase